MATKAKTIPVPPDVLARFKKAFDGGGVEFQADDQIVQHMMAEINAAVRVVEQKNESLIISGAMIGIHWLLSHAVEWRDGKYLPLTIRQMVNLAIAERGRNKKEIVN